MDRDDVAGIVDSVMEQKCAVVASEGVLFQHGSDPVPFVVQVDHSTGTLKYYNDNGEYTQYDIVPSVGYQVYAVINSDGNMLNLVTDIRGENIVIASCPYEIHV